MFYHHDSTLYNHCIWNRVVKPYKDPFTKSKNKNNIGIDTLNTVNYGIHVNSPMYCSHHLNCLANILLLRLVGKTHTGNYYLISYPHTVPTNFAVLPLPVFRAELSFYSVSQKKKKRIKSIWLYRTRLQLAVQVWDTSQQSLLCIPTLNLPARTNTHNHCTRTGNAGHLPWRMLSSAKRCWRTEKTEEE